MLRVYDSVAQPWLQMEITDLNAENAAAAEQAVLDELRRLAEQGIDRAKLEAALARREFEMRERDFGPYTPGVGLCMQTRGQLAVRRPAGSQLAGGARCSTACAPRCRAATLRSCCGASSSKTRTRPRRC